MKVAITGGTGFVGRNLAVQLASEGHEVVSVARGKDRRDERALSLPNVRFVAGNMSEPSDLVRAFEECEAVAHLAGINREIGSQTYDAVHVQGTRNVVEAAEAAGVRKLILLSFLRARPNCGSSYHESKFAAEEIVRASSLDHSIFKAGVIYGQGDHMLDHISQALHTFPFFLLVGFKGEPMRPLAVEDLAKAMAASLTAPDLSRRTFSVVGPEEMTLREAVERIARVAHKRRPILPAPIWLHYAMAWFFERTMTIPLASKAQVRILSESLVEPLPFAEPVPERFLPTTAFTDEQIRKGLPAPQGFSREDCLCSARRAQRI